MALSIQRFLEGHFFTKFEIGLTQTSASIGLQHLVFFKFMKRRDKDVGDAPSYRQPVATPSTFILEAVLETEAIGNEPNQLVTNLNLELQHLEVNRQKNKPGILLIDRSSIDLHIDISSFET